LPLSVYGTPEELAESVLRDLSKAIEMDFPAALRPDPLEEEQAHHAAFAGTRRRVFVRHGSDGFDVLDRFVDGGGSAGESDAEAAARMLVVAGPGGIGKSALLANWLATRKVPQPTCKE
jgi:hypothetical protein